MNVSLKIPRPAGSLSGVVIQSPTIAYTFALRWIENHPWSSYGAGVLADCTGNCLLDGFMFRHLRDTIGAWIETDQPELVARCLGVPWQEDFKEDGIGHPPKNSPAPRSIDAK